MTMSNVDNKGGGKKDLMHGGDDGKTILGSPTKANSHLNEDKSKMHRKDMNV